MELGQLGKPLELGKLGELVELGDPGAIFNRFLAFCLFQTLFNVFNHVQQFCIGATIRNRHKIQCLPYVVLDGLTDR